MNTHRNWHLLDAQQLVLGRLASQAAQLIMGKHKPGFVRYHDHGDYVVVINAQKVKTTGRKTQQKVYTSYSGYPGGLKSTPLSVMLSQKPTAVIENAVKGMLPKNKLQKDMLKRLKIYADSNHPYSDQITKSGSSS